MRRGNAAFSVVQAEVVVSKLQKRGGGGSDKDEGEDSEILRWQNQQGLGTDWGG